jgi:hypothetical protein
MPLSDPVAFQAYQKRYRETVRKARRAADPFFKEKNAAATREWLTRKNAEGPEFKEHRKQYMQEWRTKNKDHQRQYRSQYHTNKYHSDPSYKLICLTRARIKKVLKGQRRDKRSIEILGCPPELARLILEAQCNTYYGMSWDTHGDWHVDHKRPISSFSLDRVEEAFHISNLQPLWAFENLSKGAKCV